jgi:alkyldihydroxyacetonephosphate synthase
MKLWNGWGTVNTPYPLPPAAAAYLAEQVGPGTPPKDANLEEVLASVPPTRLPAHPLVKTDPETRLRHARGQSLADWIALRSGQIGAFPDGVAFPTNDQQVQDLLAYARQTGARVIPYGGGTSVVGHINVIPDNSLVLTIAMSEFNRLVELDRTSNLATVEAGVTGPQLEEQLNAQGYTLGHFPQSFEYSTLGGWVASRSVGTQCYYYGRIEDLFAGGHLESPNGPMEIPPMPASAAGPDLRHLVLGSEGRMGIITRATVRVSQLPEHEKFQAVFFPTWLDGVNALREISQARIPVSMLRLSNPQETETTLQLSGKSSLVNLAHTGLNLIGIGETRCLMIYGLTGKSSVIHSASHEVGRIAHKYHGFPVNMVIGKMWHKTRFTTPYLRNTLWEHGYALDTLETCLTWSHIEPAMTEIQNAIRRGLEDVNERVLVFAHLSHMYNDGASMYITYLYRQASDPAETMRRWQVMKTAASQTIVQYGGTISHQHGIGLDHAPYLAAEKGELGMKVLPECFKTFDPDGLMNPGKLLK